NGQPREVLVPDHSLTGEVPSRPKAEAGNPLHVGAPMPGLVVRVAVAAGDEVEAGRGAVTRGGRKRGRATYAQRGGGGAEGRGPGGTGGAARWWWRGGGRSRRGNCCCAMRSEGGGRGGEP